jgi:heme exporter protein D
MDDKTFFALGLVMFLVWLVVMATIITGAWLAIDKFLL